MVWGWLRALKSVSKAKANPLAAILSGALMLDYLGERTGSEAYAVAARAIDDAVEAGFAASRIRPMEFGGDMGTVAVTREILAQIDSGASPL